MKPGDQKRQQQTQGKWTPARWKKVGAGTLTLGTLTYLAPEAMLALCIFTIGLFFLAEYTLVRLLGSSSKSTKTSAQSLAKSPPSKRPATSNKSTKTLSIPRRLLPTPPPLVRKPPKPLPSIPKQPGDKAGGMTLSSRFLNFKNDMMQRVKDFDLGSKTVKRDQQPDNAQKARPQ